MLYTLNALAKKHGLGLNTLKGFVSKGYLQPTLCTGTQKKYSDADWAECCRRTLQMPVYETEVDPPVMADVARKWGIKQKPNKKG